MTSPAIFTRDVLWMGPDVPSGTVYEGSPTNITMDLAQVQGAFILGGEQSSLYFQRITMINPLVASEMSTNSGYGTFQTAIPIWAIQFMRYEGRGTQIYM